MSKGSIPFFVSTQIFNCKRNNIKNVKLLSFINKVKIKIYIFTNFLVVFLVIRGFFKSKVMFLSY